MLLQTIVKNPILVVIRPFSSTNFVCARRWQDQNRREDEKDLTNPAREVAGMNVYPEKGAIADNKPFKFKVEKYMEYTWCGCGYGRGSQPFCDKSCKNLYLKKIIKNGPVQYIAPETKEVWFCNCKQTNNRPFCDGTHRTEEVKEARLDYNKEVWEPTLEKKKKR